MAIATISVNFATAAEVNGSGTLTAVKSINPSVLRSAFTAGASFGWTPFINTMQLATSIGVRTTNPTTTTPLKAIHVGPGTTTPATTTANAILVNTSAIVETIR